MVISSRTAVVLLLAFNVAQGFVAKPQPRCVLRRDAGFGAATNRQPKKKKKDAAPKPKPPPELCPCHSGLPYATCCAQYHADHTTVPDPESLLRSRYAAFSLMLPEFLVDTTHPDHKDYGSGTRAERVAKMSKGLEASRFTALRVKCQECKGDDEHEITFEADIQPAKQRGYGAKAVTLFERSVFKRREGVWLYAEGLDVNAETTKASR